MDGHPVIDALTKSLCSAIEALPTADEKIDALNTIRTALHRVSPMADEPVDLVLWVPAETIIANEYNPNKVASPEMRLLEDSIREDGYTQPIVTSPQGSARVVVDGFHRHLVGRKPRIASRIHHRLPVVALDKDIKGRMASTVRHNRARGKHQVDLMAAMLKTLLGLGWDDGKIARQLGMTGDELIRLKQQTGLAGLYANQPYGRAWECPTEDYPEEKL